MTRYARQIILPELGQAGQARLSSAHVLVVGAGGLAAPALPLLAGAGVGRITVLDADKVDLSNLHRQTLFTEKECGRYKAEVAATRCRAINSDIEITAAPVALTPANADGFVSDADLVLDCADSYAASYVLSDTCRGANTPLVSASALGWGGYVGGFCGGAPSLRAVFPELPDNSASCATAGVLGPVVGMLGAMQAQMALNALLGLSPSPLGQLVRLDAMTLRTTSFRFDTAPEPDQSLPFMAPSQLGRDDLIVDLRGTDEAPDLIHPDALRIAPEDVASALPPQNRRLALCCATGLRAWRTADKIHTQWPGEIVLVAAATS